MGRSRLRPTGALLTAIAMLALQTVTTAAPVSAAKQVTCGGQVATIVGTKQGERIVGTNGPDVIAGLGGNDVIIGRGGNDLICGGPGADRLVGKTGLDRLYGNAGPDRLFGGDGPDRLFGGVGNDLLAGQAGNDRLDGGPGTDRCYQGPGTGAQLGCEPWLLPLTGILAIAYSDIDGLDGYSSGDVMISKLVDTNGDKVPSAGDTVRMGRYPTDFDANAFGDWGVKSHVVASLADQTAAQLVVLSGIDYRFYWYAEPGELESYVEIKVPVAVTSFQDSLSVAYQDGLQTQASPSSPRTAVGTAILSRASDDPFLDVVLNYPVP